MTALVGHKHLLAQRYHWLLLALTPDKTLLKLRQTIDEQFRILDDWEKKTRSALAKLEADFIRRFLEMGEYG